MCIFFSPHCRLPIKLIVCLDWLSADKARLRMSAGSFYTSLQTAAAMCHFPCVVVFYLFLNL